jgi:F-type H+-transporting ATPase subunit b
MLSLRYRLINVLHPTAPFRRFARHFGPSLLVAVGAFLIAVAALTAPVGAQTHEAPPPNPAAPAAQQSEHSTPKEASAHAAPAGGGHQGEAEAKGHGSTLVQTIAKLFNFALLVGILAYYLKAPISAYLVSRSTQIRQDLVTAAETRAAAAAQLAEIERSLKALPAELEALKVRGAEDVKTEKVRIAEAAGAERERLLDQTRREIALQLRIARRELVELGADLAVGVARQHITRSITPDDQIRLVDRYAAQLAGPAIGKELR